jgi:hypothetical protein
MDSRARAKNAVPGKIHCAVPMIDAVVPFARELCRAMGNANWISKSCRHSWKWLMRGAFHRGAPARRVQVDRQSPTRRLEAELGVQLLARSTRGARSPRPGPRSATTRPGSAPRSTWPGKRSCPLVPFAAACALPAPLSFRPDSLRAHAGGNGATSPSAAYPDMLQRSLR